MVSLELEKPKEAHIYWECAFKGLFWHNSKQQKRGKERGEREDEGKKSKRGVVFPLTQARIFCTLEFPLYFGAFGPVKVQSTK